MLRKHAYTSDISKAYLRVLVDPASRKLRIFVWFEDPDTIIKPKNFLRNTIDFGDGVSSAILTIVQRKCLPIIQTRTLQADSYSESLHGQICPVSKKS